MARSIKNQQKIINTILAWSIGLIIFFPILWTILTSFKTEGQAINNPPLFLFFDWTLDNYAIVQERSDYMLGLWHLLQLKEQKIFCYGCYQLRCFLQLVCFIQSILDVLN